MTKKKTHYGKCRICGQNKELSYEHIPPRVALNKSTRFVSVPHEEWTKIEDFIGYTPKGQILQGGIGYYSLCRECNSFLGQNYVRAYERWIESGVQVMTNFNVDYFKYIALKQEPLRILKQILSMFIGMNDDWYSQAYPDLIAFVRDPKSNYLPERYRVFAYLNNEGQYRYIKHCVVSTPTLGIINLSELTFPPFGYVLTFDFNHNIHSFANITYFKNYKLGEVIDIDISIFKLPTILPFSPLDYRTKDKINMDINASR
nr:hypothetical protein [Cytophagales bacterium]